MFTIPYLLLFDYCALPDTVIILPLNYESNFHLGHNFDELLNVQHISDTVCSMIPQSEKVNARSIIHKFPLFTAARPSHVSF